MIIIDPVTAKIAAKAAIQVLTDEESRKKVLYISLIPIITVVMILTIAYYILSSPIEMLDHLFNNQEHTVYAQNLQSQYGYIGGDAVIDISGDYVQNEIPLLMQTDSRWRNLSYGQSGTIGSSACGPSSMAMIAVGLTGDTSINPKTVADWSAAHGHRIEGIGTAWSLFPAYSAVVGIDCEEVSVSASDISTALRSGKVMITSMKPGHFTNQGHFIVLRGITDSGKILVNDPASRDRSRQEWDVSIIINEAKGAWAFSKR